MNCHPLFSYILCYGCFMQIIPVGRIVSRFHFGSSLPFTPSILKYQVKVSNLIAVAVVIFDGGYYAMFSCFCYCHCRFLQLVITVCV